MKYKFGRSSHAVYSLHYHLILVTKYGRPFLEAEEVRGGLKEVFWSLQDKLGIEIVAQEPNKDHIHILFKAERAGRVVVKVNPRDTI